MQWYGPSHLWGLLGCGLACLVVARLASWVPPSRQILRRALLANLWLYVLIAYSWRWPHLSWATGLPLHLCDLILLGAIVLLSHRDRLPRVYEALFLWSCCGSIWALLTPDLPQDFPHYRYFEFFWGHGLIFVVLSFLQAGCGYAPQPDSWKRAGLGLSLWSLLVGGLDWAFGWNYGYLRCPPPGSLLAYLGPWPLYIVVANLWAWAAFRWICRFAFRGEAAASRDSTRHNPGEVAAPDR